MNWGKAIVLAFVLFMGFILYFVIKVQSDSKYDNDLVIEEYYKYDTRYGEEMTLVQNAEDLLQKPIIDIAENGIVVLFPPVFDAGKISGTISLYRPSDKRLDFERKLSLAGNSMLIPKSELAGGRWDITIAWDYDGVSYKQKKTAYLD
jgi:hypothetical protein